MDKPSFTTNHRLRWAVHAWIDALMIAKRRGPIGSGSVEPYARADGMPQYNRGLL